MSFFKKESLASPALWYGLMLLSVSLLDRGEIKVIRLVDILALITFILLLKEKLLGQRELQLSTTPQIKIIAGFTVIAGLALVYSFTLPLELNIPGAVGAKAPYVRGFVQTGKLFFALIMFYWLTYSVVNNRQILITSLRFFAIGAGVVTLYGLFQDIGYMLGFHTGQAFTETIWIVPRLNGTGKEPLNFANYLVLAIPITFFLITLEKRKVMNNLLWLVFSLEVFALILTFALGGWIGLSVVILFSLVFGFHTVWRYRSRLLISGIAVALGIALMLNIYPSLSLGFKAFGAKIESLIGINYFGFDYSPSRYSVEDRKVLTAAAIKIFKQYPVVGVGLGNYTFHFNKYRPPQVQRYNFVTVANNQYLEVLAETGILGFIFYISFILMICWKSLQAILARPPSLLKNALTFIFCGLLGVLVQYLTFSSTPLNYFWISAGLLMAVINIADKEDRVCHEDRD